MIRTYAKPLKVSTPEGERIYASITKVPDRVIIEVRPLEVVKEDDPPFAHNGVIRFSCKRENYSETIKILTQYLEDLFLKGMADESIYRGLGVKSKSRRTKKSDSSREVESDSGEGDSSSIHSGSRGDQQTESSG